MEVVVQQRVSCASSPQKLTEWVRIVPLRRAKVRTVSKKSLLRILVETGEVVTGKDLQV